MPQVGKVMACVGVTQVSALGLKNGVEAGDEHVGRDTNSQRLVHSLKNLARRRGLRRLNGELQHAAGGGHDQGCRHALAGCVPHHEAQPTLREGMEVVEVSSYLSGGPIEGRILPPFHLRHSFGWWGLWDAPSPPHLLPPPL